MLKNYIFITGNNSYQIEQEVKRWLLAFSSKYTDINIERIRIEDIKNSSDIYDTLFTTGLFSEKRLFVFSGGREKKSKNPGIEEIFEKYGTSLPEDHFCLFHNIKPNEEKLLSWMEKNADIRTVKDVWNKECWEGQFENLGIKVIENILSNFKQQESLKENGESNALIGHKIYTTLMKMSLNEGQNDEVSYITGGKIFDLIDAVLMNQGAKAGTILKKIESNTSSAEILNSLLSLLRNSLYIKYLHRQGIDRKNVEQQIKVHPFVFKKAESAHITLEQLQKFMQRLYEASIAYKSGKGLKDAELGRIFAIELALMGLKK